MVKHNIVKVEIWMSIIECMKDNMYIMNIAKKTGRTYSHIIHIMYELEKKGFLKTKTIGRTRIIILNKKGNELIKAIRKLNTVLTSK